MAPMKDVFVTLTPAPGGLNRLRARLAADRRRRAARWVGAGAVLMAAVALFWSRPVAAPVWAPASISAAVSVPPSARGIVAVKKISESDAVVFYEVASLERAVAPDYFR